MGPRVDGSGVRWEGWLCRDNERFEMCKERPRVGHSQNSAQIEVKRDPSPACVLIAEGWYISPSPCLSHVEIPQVIRY